MTTAEVRDLLIETGTPQVVPEQHIGPLPNLRAALDVLVGYCGDGNLGGEEVCDDGNEVGGDGCSSDCASDERCGNSIVDTPAGEACDDGNTWSGDGCSSDCWSNETCGNGTVDPELGETCDDGNLDDGDGCTSGCRVDRSPSDDDQDPDDPSGHPVDDDAAGDEDDGGAGWIGSANPVPGMVGGPGCHVAGATPSAGAWHDAFLGLLILAMLRLGGRRR
jgi:MYXO-CTERM domain-containing protein